MPSAAYSMKDFADEAWPGRGGQTARQLYNSQKSELAALLDRMTSEIAPASEDREAAASLLHNLAGTATYFDEESLGLLAADLELATRFASDHAAIVVIAARLRPLLGG